MESPEELDDKVTYSPPPVRETVCGEPVALSVMLRVPVRLPVEVGVKVTDNVHDPPVARLVPQLWLTAKSPEAAIEVKLRAAVPEFVSVTAWAALVLPTVSAANVRLVGESVTAGAVTTGAAPVPVNNTVCGEPIALSVTLTVPVLLPAAVGVNVTDRVQVPLAARLEPQFWLTAKSPETTIEVRANAALPEFVSVTVWAVLVVPVVCEEKVRLVGESVADGACTDVMTTDTADDVEDVLPKSPL
jgi:hypothetical protein